MSSFLQALEIQRWDDHRYYHHIRINQSLHLVSAVSFLFAYVMVFKDPAIAALVGWLVSMTTRQIGHFFFEPKCYDVVNLATHEYKEEVKVGYNLRRKVVLMTIWALSPLYLFVDPTLLHTVEPGDLVGELSFMDDEPRYAALLAAGPTEVLVLDRRDFETLVDREPRVVYKVMRAVMRVAHKVQRRLSLQMRDLENYLYRTGAKY